jgi:tetratricopeptide (TPR) repeat protein
VYQAISVLEDKVQNFDHKAAPLTERAACHEKLDEVENAKLLYQQAEKLNEVYIQLYIKHGWFLIKLGEIPKGIEILEKAFQIEPFNLKIRKKLARALLLSDENKIEEAQEHFEYVIDRDKDDYIALLGLGQVHERKQEYEEALDYLQKAMLQPKHDVNCIFFLGTVYAKVKDFKNALEKFREVLSKSISRKIILLEADKNHVEACIEVATIFSMMKDYEKVDKYFK